MQMEKKIQEEIFHLSEKKNICVYMYVEVPILLGSIYFLEVHSMKDVIGPTIKLIFKHVPLKNKSSSWFCLVGAFQSFNLFPIAGQWMLLLSTLSNACCGLSKYNHSHNNSPCSNDIIWLCTSITPTHASLCTWDMVTSVIGDCGPSSFMAMCWNRKALC